jgi:hypothetical protein
MPTPATDIPSGGRWFIASGVAFHENDAGQVDFTDADDVPGDWITIGGGPGPKGERHRGGFPAKVAGGTPDEDGKLTGGTIVGGKVAGKLGLHGKTTDEVADHLAIVNEHQEKGKSLAEAVKAANKAAAKSTRSTAAVAALPTPPGKDLGNGLYLHDGLSGEAYLVDPRRMKEAAAMADKLEAQGKEQAKKKGKKNKAEADFAAKTVADIRAQIEQLGRGELPASHKAAHELQADQNERAETGKKRSEEARATRITQNTPRYEHLKAFVDKEGYFPMPGTIVKRPTKYLGTAAQRLRLTSDGSIEVFVGKHFEQHGVDKYWHRLTDDAIGGALSTAGWTGSSKVEEAIAASKPSAAPSVRSETTTVTKPEPKTDRPQSWWGDKASRYNWNSGGHSLSDGQAAKIEGRPGSADHVSPVTPASAETKPPPDAGDGKAMIGGYALPGAAPGGQDGAIKGARGELYAMARSSGSQSDHYYAKPMGYMTSVNDPIDGEMHRLAAKLYRQIGSGEDPDAVIESLATEAKKAATDYNKSQEKKYPFDDRRAATKGIAGHMMPEAAEDKIRWHGKMAKSVLAKYGQKALTQDPWIKDNDYTPGPAPEGASVAGFVSGLKGFEHSGHQAGVGWIARHNGELVSSRSKPNGGTIETYRVRFPDRDVLCTWGQGGVVDPNHGQMPDEWRIVQDKAGSKPGEN